MAKGEGRGVVLGYLKYVLGFDSLAFEEGVGDADKRLKAAQRSLDKTASGFKSVGAKMSLAISAPLTAFATLSFNAATDAVELQSAFDQTFGDMSATMNKWAVDMGDALGRSTQEMQKAANTFGIFFNTAVDQKKAAEMSQIFAKLAQDLGSFYNTDTETAISKLRSGLSGESEPLRDFGVFLTEANVKAKALELGLTGVGNELTEQEKIIARYNLILDATKNAQGDVERTSAGTANQLRAAQAAFEELQVVVGTKLLPVITPLITKLADALNWFTSLPQPVQNTALAVAAVSAAVGPLLIGLGGIISGAGALLPLLAKAAPLFAALAGIIGGTVIPVIAAVGKALIGLAIAGGPITLIIAGVAAAIAIWKNWDTIGPIVQRLYQAVKTWIQDRLGAVWDWLGGKIEAVRKWFYNLYDAVVGHSYIPDMVTEIGNWMGKLDGNMVKPAQKATSAASQAFAMLEQAVSAIFARLYPEQRKALDYAADKTALEEWAERSKISVEALNDALRRLRADYFPDDFAGIGGLTPYQIPVEESDRMAAELAKIAGVANDNADSAEAANVRIQRSFRETAEDVMSSIRATVDAVRGGDFLSILESVINLGLQLGSIGVFGKSAAKNINSGIAGFRANGGPVSGGSTYVVGERGPELFTPSRSGYIVPNGANDNGGGRRGGNSFYFDNRGAVMTQDLLQQMNAIGEGAAVRGAMGGSVMAQDGLSRKASRRMPGR